MKKNIHRSQQGFTLIELLVVMGIIAALASIVLIALNPARHFAQARNTQRTSDVDTLLNAVAQNIAENKGAFTCTGTDPNIPTTAADISDSGYNLAQCLVPNFLPAMPFDPTLSNGHWTSSVDYVTGYKIVRNATTGRITISAPSAELGTPISITR